MELFVGRTREIALLQRRLEAESLTIVIGRAGIGKTATLRHALQGQISLWHSVRPGDGAAQTALSLLRGLAPNDAGPAVLGDPASMLDDAIDAAERGRAIVVVDDAHHLEDTEAAALMACLAQKARLARWFVSARHLPPLPERIEDVVALDDLSRASLKRMAAQLDKRLSAARIAELAEAAQGSPWLLRRLVWQRLAGQPTFDELVAALPAASASVLSLLAALELPIDRGTLLAALGQLRLPAALPGVESAAGQLRAHDLLRELAVDDPPAISPARLASAARSTGDAAALLESARLRLRRGETSQAVTLLEREFDRIVDNGYAPRLWSLVAREEDDCASALRMRAALAIGSGEPLLAVLSRPPADTLRARTLHAEVLYTAGRWDEARARLRVLAQLPGSSFEVTRLLVRANLQLGDAAEAERLCEEARPHGLVERAQHKALRARVLMVRGKLAAALALSEELEESAARLPPRARNDVENALIGVYSACGRLSRVEAVARSLYGSAARGATPLEAQGAIASLSLIAIEGGDLAEGRRLLDRLSSHAERIAFLRFFLRMNIIRIRMIEGDLEGAERDAEEVVATGRTERDRGSERWGLVALSMIAWMRGGDREMEGAAHSAQGVDAQGRFLAAFDALRRLHRGALAGPLPAPPDATHALDARIFELLAETTAALLDGRHAQAEALAREAVALGETSGYHMHGLEARLLLIDVLIIMGRRSAARAALSAMLVVVRKVSSRRFPVEASLMALLLEDDVPQASALEDIARASATAPRAARRALALLGHEAGADRVDQRVLAALRWRTRLFTPYHGTSSAARSWGLDVAQRSLWFPDGETKGIPKGSLHAELLCSLARRGGLASKEELTRDVWHVREYHPLRDDKRLQVAIFRLRRLVETNPRSPSRIAVRDDGYALAGEEPMRIREPIVEKESYGSSLSASTGLSEMSASFR